MGSQKWDTGTGKRQGGSRRNRQPSEAAEPSTTISAALGDFILYMRDEKQASPYTLDAYERDLLRFVNTLDDHDAEPQLAGVTPEQIRGHMRMLIERGLSKATVRRAMYTLSSFFGWAYRWELLRSNPTARVVVPRRERVRQIRALSKRERAVLIAAADRLAKGSRRVLDRLAPLLVRLMLKTGLRRGEVLDLTWRDVDLDHGELLVRYGKGRKSRRVPVADADLLARLREAHGAGGRDEEAWLATRVFAGTRGRRLAHSSFYRLFHRVLAQAELGGKGITPHALRHTFGSVLCARGVPVPHVSNLMGHANLDSTMIYLHASSQELRAAVKKLRE